MHLVRRHILLGKQVGREQREERNCANYHFHSCWSTQGHLLIKLKEIKFNCNQFPWAPQNYAHGREGTVWRKSVASLLSVPCDNWVTGSAGRATSPRHSPGAHFPRPPTWTHLWPPASHSSQCVCTWPCALCCGRKVPLGMQLSPARCLPSRNLCPREKGNIRTKEQFLGTFCAFSAELCNLLLFWSPSPFPWIPLRFPHLQGIRAASELENRIGIKSEDDDSTQLFILQVNSINKSFVLKNWFRKCKY